VNKTPAEGAINDSVSMLDRPREDRPRTGKSTADGPTAAEILDDALEDLRNSTITTYAAGLDSSGLKSALVFLARYPVVQLGIFLVGVLVLSFMVGVISADRTGSSDFNFIFFLLYFLAVVYFSKYPPATSLGLSMAMAGWAVVLFGIGLSGFKPTLYFIVALVLVGVFSTMINNRFITRAAEQTIRARQLQNEIMRRDTFAGKMASKDLDKDMDGFKEREMDFRKQKILFSELFIHLRSLSVSLNEKERFTSLHFILDKGLKVEAVEVFFLDDSRTHLFVADAAEKQASGKFEKVTLDNRIRNDNENLLSRCVNEGRSYAPEDIERDTLLKGLRDRSPHPTIYCAPLVAENEVRGVLNISKAGKTSLDEVEKRLFVATAAVAGAAFNNAKTFLLTQEELKDKEQLTEKEKQERIKTRNLLDRIMDRKIVEEVMKNPDKTYSDRIKITTLLADVRGFTTMSEAMNPREVVDLLNTFFSTLTPIIFKYDGTLDKYIGDEIMALFGPPKPKGNHAEMAIPCALEMRTAFKKVQQRWKREKNLDLEMGIALNTGDAIVGFIGSENLTNYTAIGDSVNTAARLEDVTPAGKIYITEYTYTEVADFIEARPVSSVTFKGKSHKVDYFEVLSLKAKPHTRNLAAPSSMADGRSASTTGKVPTADEAAARQQALLAQQQALLAQQQQQAQQQALAQRQAQQQAAQQQAAQQQAAVQRRQQRAAATSASHKRAAPQPDAADAAQPAAKSVVKYCRICGSKITPGQGMCAKCGTPT